MVSNIKRLDFENIPLPKTKHKTKMKVNKSTHCLVPEKTITWEYIFVFWFLGLQNSIEPVRMTQKPTEAMQHRHLNSEKICV